jgi:hypothetical protein
MMPPWDIMRTTLRTTELGATTMRAMRFFCVKICAFTLLTPALAHADTSAKILLRGVVYSRATIGITSPVSGNNGVIAAGTSNAMAIDLAPVRGGASTAVFHLNRLANSASGFVVKIEAASAVGKTLQMAGADGATLPYNVRFDGRDVAFEGREAELATVTRDTTDDYASGQFEIRAPRVPPGGKGFSDHIVLVVAAR